MRIFVISHNSRFGGGVSVARNLIAAFCRIAPKNDYLFTVPKGLRYEECCQSNGKSEVFVYETIGLLSRWWFETFRLPQLVAAFRPDVIFNMANSGLVSPPAPQAILVQDPHLFYEYSCFGRITLQERVKFAYHRARFKRVLINTQLLFCQTEVAKKRICERYNYTSKICICPNQLSTFAGNAVTQEAGVPVPLKGLQAKFKLFVLTRYYCHKNLEIIVKTFDTYREALKDVVAVLTIAPDQHSNAAKLLRQVRRKGLDENIVTVGQLTQEALGVYYRNTDASFLPTLLESFSGTYIEAMRFKRPILTSDMDFARSVCGDAALYFNPMNPGDICAKILKLKNSPELRNSLVAAGDVRCNQQSIDWDEIARGVLDELEKLCSQKPNYYV